MSTNSREGTLRLDGSKLQDELEQVRYDWPQASQSVFVTEPGRPAAAVWAAVSAAALAVGYSFRDLLRQAAPAGESNFKRQML